MRELIQNTALSSSDKAIFIAGAAIVIVLILVILYKIDQMPPEYQKRKKHCLGSAFFVLIFTK